MSFEHGAGWKLHQGWQVLADRLSAFLKSSAARAAHRG